MKTPTRKGRRYLGKWADRTKEAGEARIYFWPQGLYQVVYLGPERRKRSASKLNNSQQQKLIGDLEDVLSYLSTYFKPLDEQASKIAFAW